MGYITCEEGNLHQKKKILLYPVGHCYNSLLLTMEKMAYFLVKSGYDVTMIVNDGYNESKSNVDMTNVSFAKFAGPQNITTMCDLEDSLSNNQVGMLEIINVWMSSTVEFCQALLNSDLLDNIRLQNYDLIILDRSDWCSAIIAEAVNIPFVIIASSPNAFNADELYRFFHTPTNLSPRVLQWPMSFVDRLTNVFIRTVAYAMRLYFIPQIQALKVSYDITPSQHLTEVYDKAALNLLYSDQRADYPRPLYAHEVEIGFLFPEIVQPVLPSEVSEFIGEDKNVIVVSFGSQIGKLSDKFIDVAVEIFTRMPYKVIIRANDFSQSYTNILVLPWIPQSELLASGQVCLLITHGGQASAMESIYNGVPMVIIPLHDEQAAQAEKLANYLNVARVVDFHSLTVDSLTAAMEYVLSEDSPVKTNVRALSSSVKHGVVSPSDTFLYWINETIFQSKCVEAVLPQHPVKLNILQWLMVDIFLSIAVILVMAVMLIRPVCSSFIRIIYYKNRIMLNRVKED